MSTYWNPIPGIGWTVSSSAFGSGWNVTRFQGSDDISPDSRDRVPIGTHVKLGSGNIHPIPGSDPSLRILGILLSWSFSCHRIMNSFCANHIVIRKLLPIIRHTTSRLSFEVVNQFRSDSLLHEMLELSNALRSGWILMKVLRLSQNQNYGQFLQI